MSEKTFELDATETLGQVRQTLARVMAESRASITRAADVERQFGLDSKLAWQVFRMGHVVNPLEAGTHVPSPTTVRRLLKAIAKHGIDANLVAELKEAFDAFESLVHRHAGDRAAFDSLIASLAGRGGEQIDLSRRRDAFRGNSHLYGVSTKAQFYCVLLKATGQPEHMDLCMIRGYVDLVQFRSDASLILTRFWRGPTANAHSGRNRAPLDPAGEEECGGPILREFSSTSPARLETIERSPGEFITRLLGGGVGRQMAKTYVLGEVFPNVHVPPDGDALLNLVSAARVPAETVLLDHLVSESMFGRLVPETTFWGTPTDELNLQQDLWGTRYLATRLPVPNTSAYVGKGPAVLHTSDVPRYEEMVCYACDRLGWDLREFDIYRTRVEYPVLHAVISTEFRAAC